MRDTQQCLLAGLTIAYVPNDDAVGFDHARRSGGEGEWCRRLELYSPDLPRVELRENRHASLQIVIYPIVYHTTRFMSSTISFKMEVYYLGVSPYIITFVPGFSSEAYVFQPFVIGVVQL